MTTIGAPLGGGAAPASRGYTASNQWAPAHHAVPCAFPGGLPPPRPPLTPLLSQGGWWSGRPPPPGPARAI
eukprot:4652088-Alexandrium_andersonii.AAC.1